MAAPRERNARREAAPADLYLEPVVQHRKTYLQVVDKILAIVSSGAVRPGERLPTERELAIRLHVSRPTVREAISALEVLGVLESRVGSGTTVVTSDLRNASADRVLGLASELESPLEIVEARLLLEMPLVDLAARRASPEAIAEIRARLEQMQREFDADGVFSLESDRDFHMAIAKAAENRLMERLVSLVYDVANQVLWANVRNRLMSQAGLAARYLAEHRTLAELIARHDGDGARAQLQVHIEHVVHDVQSPA
jgi:GntR family transcriptional regulator, transcriptional repressor for pyruvate dehydrogenase complex